MLIASLDTAEDEFEKMFANECRFERKASSLPLTVRSAPD